MPVLGRSAARGATEVTHVDVQVNPSKACSLQYMTDERCDTSRRWSLSADMTGRDREPELSGAMGWKRLFVLSALSMMLPLGTAWSGEAMTQRPFGWRWGIDPIPLRYPQPSLLGPTGYFDLQTTESLQRGNYSVGLFGTFEKVFTADFVNGNDRQRLRLDRYSGILSAAYGILDNLEVGLAVRGVNTDAEVKQTIAGDVSSGDVHETGFGKIRVGVKYRPAAFGVPALSALGFAGIALEPFVDIQTHGFERGLSYPYRDQDTVYGMNLLMGGQAGPVGVHWRFGYSRTDGSNVDNFLVLGSPFNVDARGLSDGERIGYALAFNYQPGPYLNLIVKGEGDTSVRHPWETREDHRVNALAGAVYGFQSGVAVHAAWQVDLHDPIPDQRGNDLDYRIIAGVSYSFARPVAAPPPSPPLPPPPPPPAPPAERRVERIVLQSVHFEFDRSRLTPLGRRVLDEAAQKLQANPNLSVEIEGHTDSIGTELYNLGLGKRRAEVVKGYLVLRHQVDPKRMMTVSFGETRPIADNRTQEGRALNRRVEFKVLIR
jgi:outer membrane protein OmpA-like peptidoglycan-associated protein